MNHGILLLFAIPALCIAVIAIKHFGDEMFKKKFLSSVGARMPPVQTILHTAVATTIPNYRAIRQKQLLSHRQQPQMPVR